MALQYGADDVLEKPFALDECLARARVLLRRYTELNHIGERSYVMVNHDAILLDTARRIVYMAGTEVALARKEYEILVFLVKHSNCVLTYQQIYKAVWKDVYLDNNSTIFYHVGNLRKKLKDEKLIESVYGVGYRIKKELAL